MYSNKIQPNATLQGIDHISHLDRRKIIIFKNPLGGDMLVPRRVEIVGFYISSGDLLDLKSWESKGTPNATAKK